MFSRTRRDFRALGDPSSGSTDSAEIIGWPGMMRQRHDGASDRILGHSAPVLRCSRLLVFEGSTYVRRTGNTRRHSSTALDDSTGAWLRSARASCAVRVSRDAWVVPHVRIKHVAYGHSIARPAAESCRISWPKGLSLSPSVASMRGGRPPEGLHRNMHRTTSTCRTDFSDSAQGADTLVASLRPAGCRYERRARARLRRYHRDRRCA